jgi:hypothetical protein
MCKPKASVDLSAPLAVTAVALAGVVVGSAASALISSVLLVALVVMAVLAVTGVAGVVVLVRRDRDGLWRPAPARAAVRRTALPAGRAPVLVLPARPRLAIEAPARLEAKLREAGLQPADLDRYRTGGLPGRTVEAQAAGQGGPATDGVHLDAVLGVAELA